MYYRRKILISLLEAFEGELEKFQLQKLLMIFSTYQETPNYHFVPYKYGCFSFQANADLATMRKYNLVEEGETTWKKLGKEIYQDQIGPKDQAALYRLKMRFNGKSSEELITYTYKKFPYLAINSKVAGKYLNETELQIVQAERPSSSIQALFTIGYEGLSLEEYINKLIAADVKVLCDVRKNSFSMKYGFNKSQLETACEGVGIQFLHIPEVGIVPDKRKGLHSQGDYDLLFEDYKKTVLTHTLSQQQYILDLIKVNQRVAITCFEANICQCHRKHLAEAICQLPTFEYELLHL